MKTMDINNVSAISTVCKNCLFAIYDGKTQIGCKFNRTDKADTHNYYKLIEAEDDEKEFYIVDNHICPYQRTDSWAHANDADIVARVKEEVFMPWAAILFYKNNVDDLKKRIQELKAQSVQPNIVTLVLSSDIPSADLKDVLTDIDNSFNVWYVQKLLDKDLPDRLSIDICFDKMKRNKFMFYACFESDKFISTEFYSKIHTYVIDDMKRYGVIKEQDSIHNMTVSKPVHKKYGGNGNNVALEYKVAYENQELTQDEVRAHGTQLEDLKSNFIVDYGQL
ncbi:MAG: hypothetical protein ACXAC2_08435 [Candidatus Kariarchaeaceae archaeon]|jgi:hypothetical protein